MIQKLYLLLLIIQLMVLLNLLPRLFQKNNDYNILLPLFLTASLCFDIDAKMSVKGISFKRSSLNCIYEIGKICPVMFIIMNLHCPCINIWFKSIICIRQRREIPVQGILQFLNDLYCTCYHANNFRTDISSCSHQPN